MGFGAMGAVLLAGGTKERFALPNARVLIHQGSGGFSGGVPDIEVAAREALRPGGQVHLNPGGALEVTQRVVKRRQRPRLHMSAQEEEGAGGYDEVLEAANAAPSSVAASGPRPAADANARPTPTRGGRRKATKLGVTASTPGASPRSKRPPRPNATQGTRGNGPVGDRRGGSLYAGSGLPSPRSEGRRAGDKGFALQHSPATRQNLRLVRDELFEGSYPGRPSTL